MTYPSSKIVNLFLAKAEKENSFTTPLHLQKLLYFAQGWWLAKFPDPLINSTFQAWDYGPVCPDVYTEFKKFRGDVIPYGIRMSQSFFYDEEKTDTIDPNVNSLIDFIWKTYASHSGKMLSEMTHIVKEGNPWREVRKSTSEKNSSIPNDLIQQYFKTCKQQKELF